MVAAIAALIEQFARASSALAAEWYEQERDNAGGRTRFTVPVADPPPLEQVEAVVSWATRQLRSARVVDEFDVFDPAKLGDLVDLDALENLTPPPGREARIVENLPDSVGDPQVALDKMVGAAQKMVADTGRETIARAVDADVFARGWARVPTGATTCWFCAMMCTRGGVYKDANTGGRNANNSPGLHRVRQRQFVGDGDFKFHDNCDCAVIPILSGEIYEPTDQIKEWTELYKTSTKRVYGSKPKRDAFRKAYRIAQGAHSPDEPTEAQG